jgi:hypothetical protein
MRLIDAALRLELPMGRYGYLAPQLKQAKRIAWRYLKHYARKIPGTKVSETELMIELPNGASITVMGADRPDTIRGEYFDGVVIDETGQIKTDLWGSVIRPMLADRKGWALFNFSVLVVHRCSLIARAGRCSSARRRGSISCRSSTTRRWPIRVGTSRSLPVTTRKLYLLPKSPD